MKKQRKMYRKQDIKEMEKGKHIFVLLNGYCPLGNFQYNNVKIESFKIKNEIYNRWTFWQTKPKKSAIIRSR